MKSTTKLAIGAGIGLAGIAGIALAMGSSSKPPVPPVPPNAPTATSFQQGSTYEFSVIDPTQGTTASVQTSLKAGGWQVQSISNVGAKSGAGATGTGYVVKALRTGSTLTAAAVPAPLVLVLAIGPL